MGREAVAMATIDVRRRADFRGGPKVRSGSRPAIHGTEIASIQFPDSSRREDVVNALAEVADLKPESPASEAMA